MVIGKNRYVPTTVISTLKSAAEQLALRSADGFFTTIEYRHEVNMGRNFVIAVLEYFDRIGFTIRVGDHRRLWTSDTFDLCLERTQK